MAATKLGVLFVLLLYTVKIHLIIAQAIPGACGGACTGYGFCGGIYPTVVDTSNTDPLDILLPMLLLAMYKKLGAAAAEETAAINVATPTCGADTSGCACCCGGCAPQCCQAYSQCGGGCSAGCACSCGGSGGSCGTGCGSANRANACSGCCMDAGFSAGCGGCNNAMSGNCGGCVCC